MDERIAHHTLVMLHRYFYNASRIRLCECGCGRRVSLENYWKHPTTYRKVPEFIRGHSSRHPQTPKYVAQRAEAIRRTLDREYSACYHRHDPGPFPRKSKEWMERQPKSLRLAFYTERSKRMRAYGTAFSKISRRLRGRAKSPPSFTTREKVEIDNSAHLSKLLQKLKAQYPQWVS
jgi:hypothetical protein